MISTRALGTIVEYQCATALMELGCVVSFPLGDFAKYDLRGSALSNSFRPSLRRSTTRISELCHDKGEVT